MTTKRTATRNTMISVIGDGADAERWVRALRGVEGVEVQRVAAGSEDELLGALSRASVHGVVCARTAPDLPGLVRQALMARRHVLVAGPVALSSTQITSLEELARRRERALVFDTGALGDERLAFVRKMTSGPQGLWRPRYVRSLRTGAQADATLDELAISDLAVALAVVGGAPAQVSAVSPRVDDEAGAADAAMVTVSLEGGPVVRVDVSLVEPWMRQELVVACDGRTIVMDALDARAPLQIQAATRHRVPQGGGQWAETVNEHPAADTMGREARAAEAFVTAVRTDDASSSSARELAVAALVWEKARESMTQAGQSVAVSEAGYAGRPTLQLIRGGGHRVDAATPELTVVRTPQRA
jgi:predicted dehydrogenase